MTEPAMDDAEEEALFARLKRGLELVRRDASLAQSDGTVVPMAPDPETTAALARVEASLRTLASNVDALARRADAVDAAIETRVETTAARTTAGLRAEIERLSAAVALLSSRAEVTRPEPVRVVPPGKPVSERLSAVPLPPRRFGVVRALLTALIVLLLIALGITAATRLGYGPDRLAVGRNLQERFSAWRSAWLPQQHTAAPVEQAKAASPPVGSDPAAKPLATADNSGEPTPAQITPAPATTAPSASSAAAAPPQAPPQATASSVENPPPAPSGASAPAAPPALVAQGTNDTTTNAAQAASPTTAPATTAPQPAASRASAVTLRAKAPVWVEVRERKGHILLRRTLQAGETWSTPSDSQGDLLLSAGNVRNLELSVDGTPQPLPPTKGGVLRDARIDSGG